MRARSVIALLAALLIAAVGAPAASAQQQRTISVAGEASLTARNDAARVGFGVVAIRSTRRAALDAASRRLRRVIATLQGQGVAERDIRTGSVSLSRRRDRRGRPIAGFRASQGVRAVVREARRAGTVVTAAVDAGATSVSGPSFFISDPRALLRRALGAAFQDAGGVVEQEDRSFSEGGGGQRPRSAPAPTRPGTTRVDASVDVVFEAR